MSADQSHETSFSQYNNPGNLSFEFSADSKPNDEDFAKRFTKIEKNEVKDSKPDLEVAKIEKNEAIQEEDESEKKMELFEYVDKKKAEKIE